MSFGSILFTSKGSALQVKASTGAALVFTKIVMGSGYLNGQSQSTLSEVMEPKITVCISEIKRKDTQAVIKGNFTNESSAIGFYWREIGLYANDPDLGEILYCYGNAGTLAEYIPPESSQLIEKVISIVAMVGNVEKVSAVIDSSAFATKADFERYSEQVSEFSSQVASSLKVEQAEGTETEIKLTNLSYADGSVKTFKAKYTSTAANKTINGKHWYKPGTTTSPVTTAGKAYTIWYDAAGDCFFIKASAEGNVTAERVLANYTFSNDIDTGISGTMIDRSTGHQLSDGEDGTVDGRLYMKVPKGYYDGLVSVYANDPDFTPANFLATKNIFGKQGAIPVWDTANNYSADDFFSGSGVVYIKPRKGYHSPGGDAAHQNLIGGWTYAIDSDFVPANFLANKNIFGMQGSIPVRDGTWVTPAVLSGHTGGIYVVPPEGWYSGNSDYGAHGGINIIDANLASENIVKDKNILGVVGTAQTKQYASGTVAASGSYNYPQVNGNTLSSWPAVVVSGLSFTPSVIICEYDDGTQVYRTIYDGSAQTHYTKQAELLYYNKNVTYNGSTIPPVKADTSPCYVSSTGFLLPAQYPGATYTWRAYQ